jgi:hypothetical protein
MPQGPGAPKSEVKETGETKVIEGYHCRKVTINNGKISAEAWITDDIQMNFGDLVNDISSAMRQPRPGSNPADAQKMPKFPAGLRGFPVLVTSTNVKTKEVTTFALANVKKQPVEEKVFDITGYRQVEVPMMPPPPPGMEDREDGPPAPPAPKGKGPHTNAPEPPAPPTPVGN